MDFDIIVPFIIIFLITIITIFLIYPSARFNRVQKSEISFKEDSLERVYNPLWFITYGIIFYAWTILCKESKTAYYLTYIFSILQLISLSLLYYFMNQNTFYYLLFILSTLVILIISIIYQKVIVFILLIINILLFFYFFQTIENTTWGVSV